MNKLFVSVLILSLFLVAGIGKISNFKSTVGGFMSKTSLPLQISQLAIIAAILIEVVAPLIVIQETFTGRKMYSNFALSSLIVFTILATIIYHSGDLSGALKNASVIGGMILLMK